MCGIIGLAQGTPVYNDILNGLETLEYRGYDSAGLATYGIDSVIDVRHAIGDLTALRRSVDSMPIGGTTGMGHIRWATHGAPTLGNTHPIMGQRVAVVHNGIIENYQEIKTQLSLEGFSTKTDTDTEIIALLMDKYILAGKTPMECLEILGNTLRGSYAIVVLCQGDSNIYFARMGSPLVLGAGKGVNGVASDAVAFPSPITMATYLHNGDYGYVNTVTIVVANIFGNTDVREEQLIIHNAATISKEGYAHFMLKEIYEQPDIIAKILTAYTSHQGHITFTDIPDSLRQRKAIQIVACGTSFHAGMLLQYVIEDIVNIPCSVTIASEFQYRAIPIDHDSTLYIVISQSGETADTLAAMRIIRSKGGTILAIINAFGSAMARESQYQLYTHAGIEVGVASTKAFIAQVTVGILFAYWLKDPHHGDSVSIVHELRTIENTLRDLLASCIDDIKNLASFLSTKSSMMYLARHALYPMALEGALKIKEIAYIHAEGLPAGEMKHGHIALVDSDFPVVFLVHRGSVMQKTLVNAAEVHARQGIVIVIGDEESINLIGDDLRYKIVIPGMLTQSPILAPIVFAIPLQLLAYYTALAKGCSIDKPRNLAKSVTVG